MEKTELEVSINGGTSKWMVCKGKPLSNGMRTGGTPISGNHQYTNPEISFWFRECQLRVFKLIRCLYVWEYLEATPSKLSGRLGVIHPGLIFYKTAFY
jgi:hypothetical protein